VQSLTKQLDGRFEIQGGSGTISRIVIPERMLEGQISNTDQ